MAGALQCEICGGKLVGKLGGVFEWTDIVAASAGNTHTMGLKVDGTVIAAGNDDLD